MTAADTFAKLPRPGGRFRLPDIPERHPDDMTSVDNLHRHGAIANIIQYLGHPETTIVSAEHYVVPGPAYVAGESRYPDLLVAFAVNPAAYAASNGYVVSEQGKPPDFILEVASRCTARDDLEAKKDYYERMEVGEYWLFDSAAEFYGFTLRGYRLAGGRYQPIEMREIRPGVFQGRSLMLNLNLRAEAGYLGWYDPVSGQHIPTLQSQTVRADAAEAQRDAATTRAAAERQARADAEARATAAEAQRDAAEARVRDLEERLRRQGG